MDYKVLYRKYRPDNFDKLIGQEHVKKVLQNSIVNNKIAHAYMFTGPRGTGKTSTAKIFAKALNCTNSVNGIACGECENCKNFSTTPDIIELDAASNNGVDDIREIKEGVEIAPTMGKYKIYIIDEVHMLSMGAWNAFLKTLEEPPQNVIFILATTDIQKVPITVLSRCQRFDFSRIDRELICQNLKNICETENIKYEENALKEISYMSEGCMRDALSILDQLSKVSDCVSLDVLKENYGTVTNDEINQLYTHIIYNDIDSLIELIRNIKETGIDVKIFINKILDNFINKAISMKKKSMSNNSFNQIKKIINSLNELLVRLNNSSNGYLLLELELLSFINDENNQLTNREVKQIISQEIISSDEQVDVKDMIKKDKSVNVYNDNDDFVNIRINNSFVNANKELKSKVVNNWNDFNNIIEKKGLNEFKSIVKNSTPQVVGDKYFCLLVKNPSMKIIGNSKLYNIELTYNSEFNSNYKFIFINEEDWKLTMKNFSKDKVYEYIDDSEYFNNDESSLTLAKDIFGNEKINIE